MTLLQISLHNVRNLRSFTCDLGPRFTVFWGQNGAGKTNILEALYFLSTLRSFRVNEQSLLLSTGQDLAQFACKHESATAGLQDHLKIALKRGERGTRKSIALNGKAVRSALEVYGKIPAILFTPEDLGVVRGSPSQRRQFLDRVVFAQDKQHIHDVKQYDKLLRSRNRLLKQSHTKSPVNAPLFDTYEEGLATVGARIWKRRIDLIAAITQDFQNHYQQVQRSKTPVEQQVTLNYQAQVLGDEDHNFPEDPQNLLQTALAQGRNRDIERKSTRVGPHLDDLLFMFNGVKAPNIASQGQIRALILAFKIAELDLAKAREQKPLLLLDDVSSEFDPQRNAHFFELIEQRAQQCVVTTTDCQFLHIPPAHRQDHHIQSGELVP